MLKFHYLLNNKTLRKTGQRFFISTANSLRLISASLIGLVINFILLHYKNPEVLNVYVYCVTTSGLFLLVSNWGGREFALRELSHHPSQQAKIISNILFSRLIILFVLSPILYLYHPLVSPIIILVLSFARISISVFETLLIVQKRFGYLLLIDQIINWSFIIVLFTDLNSGDIHVFLNKWLLFELVKLILYGWFLRKDLQFTYSFEDLISVFKKSTPFFAVAIAGFCCSKADLYILGIYMDSDSLSKYTIVTNFIILCQVLFGGLFGAFISNMLRMGTQAFNNFSRYVIWTGLLFACLCVAAIYLLYLLFFHQQASSLFLLMVFINLAAYSNTYTSVYYFTRLNKQNLILKVIVIAGTLNVIASLLVVPLYGFYGAFACNTGCALLTAILFKINKPYLRRENSGK